MSSTDAGLPLRARRDVAARAEFSGTDVGIEINAYDECHTEPNFQDRYGRERPRRCRPK
jgi:hypothetical protein